MCCCLNDFGDRFEPPQGGGFGKPLHVIRDRQIQPVFRRLADGANYEPVLSLPLIRIAFDKIGGNAS